MKFFLISDNVDTLIGMRLAGIEGIVVHKQQEIRKVLMEKMDDKEIAVILITEKLIKMDEKYVYDLKLNVKRPLIVGIPDRHSTSNISLTISQYVEEAIGIKL